MTFKITSVYDEGALERTQLIGAKGFSALVEADGKKVLVDTGMRGRYLMHNLDMLDVKADDLDAVVITQANKENSAGLGHLLEARTEPVKVFAPKAVFTPRKGFLSRGLDEEVLPKAEQIEVVGWTEVVPKVHVTKPFVTTDGYSESYVVVEASKLTVVSGYCHGGPDFVISEVNDRFQRKVRAFVGSVRLEKEKNTVAVAYAKCFESYGVTDLYLNHATGRSGMTGLRSHLGLHGVNDFYVGTVFEP
ncbi:MAG: MBL fold metallo-hydrolase [Candidatus Methanomethylophilaceae archaeon]|nr:MBL fold metallo-hydrolase [Candidatus Methanomethylophilaceae archaeon]